MRDPAAISSHRQVTDTPLLAVTHTSRRIKDLEHLPTTATDHCGDALARKILGAKGVDLSVPRRHQLDQFSPCRSLRVLDASIATGPDRGGV
jgi:hypothetical protein